jgi:nucleotide-binding universal stress UspA family protein
MNPIRKILVPTDFSAHADEAFRTACTLAGALGAEVVVFHIAAPPAVVTESGQLLAGPDAPDTINLWNRFRGSVATDNRVHVTHEVIVEGRPSARHILNVLAKQGCDLIVMGTHGRSWVKHALFGSVTEAVVRGAHCPVMVVKAPATAPTVVPDSKPSRDRQDVKQASAAPK